MHESAQDRAAQAFGANVFTAVNAALAEDVTTNPTDYDSADCTGAGSAGSYSWNAAPANVTGCTVVGDDTTGDVTVTVTVAQGDIVNGQTTW